MIPPRTLADVFDELAEVSLDPQAVLDITAARCAELVGDGCLIRLISEDGTTVDFARAGLEVTDDGHSMVAAPMEAHGRVVGTLIVARDADSDPLTEDDEETVVRLADRAALMFDNARVKLAEHRRADEQIRFQAGLLEQIGTAVVAVDNHRVCTDFNPAAERLFGYTRDEVLGGRLLDLLAAPGACRCSPRSAT